MDYNNLHYFGETNRPGTGHDKKWEYFVTPDAEIYRCRSEAPDYFITTKTYVTARSKRNPDGYLAVSSKHLPEKYLHRIVAKAFVYNDDPINKTDVDHIDGNKHNNLPSNLEWVTKSENQRRWHQRRRDEGRKWNGRRGDKKE